MELASIENVQFSVMSPEEIRRYAVCEVKSTKTMNAESENLYDPLMGPLKKDDKCATCGQNMIACPGHFGYIELEKKIPHIKYASTILSILRSVCYECSSPLIPAEHIDLHIPSRVDAHERLSWVMAECKSVKTCNKCEETHMLWDFNDGEFFTSVKSPITTPVHIDDVYKILRKISDKTMYAFGFNRNLSDNPVYTEKRTFISGNVKHRHQIRPEWFILTNLLIAPPCIRPCVNQGNDDERQHDDLTGKYINIIKINEKLRNDRLSIYTGKRKQVKMTEDERKMFELRLYEEISTTFDNRAGKSTLAGGRPYKCIEERVVGKEGFIRKNVEAKRCNFTARTVVDAGPSLKFYQVSVPQAVARKLTFPVYVTERNINECERWLEGGRINCIRRTIDGKVSNININKQRRKSQIRIGDVVERQMGNGDWVIFNRQPTLRVESMNAHQVVVATDPNEKVFRINLSACNGYNCDQIGCKQVTASEDGIDSSEGKQCNDTLDIIT